MVRSSPIQASSARQPMSSSWRVFGATAYDDSATTILSRCSSPVADAVIAETGGDLTRFAAAEHLTSWACFARALMSRSAR
jgi:hypothetical protein